MPALAVRKSTYDGAPEDKQRIFRWVLGQVVLGRPAVYSDPSDVLWYIYDDSRIGLNGLAYLAAFSANIAGFPMETLDREGWTERDSRLYTMGWIDHAGVTLEGTPDAVNPWQDILDRNSAPVWLKAADAVPASWEPYPPPEEPVE